MKKLLLIVCAAALSFSAAAQTKAEIAVQKKLDKSDVEIQNPKKSASISTWVSRADIYADAAMVYTSKLLAEIPAAQLVSSAIAGEPKAIEDAVVGDVPCSKYVYDNFDVYVSADGMVQFWVVTKEMIPDAMYTAIENLEQAKSLSPSDFMKNVKANNVAAKINTELLTTGVSAYNLNDYDAALKSFEGAFNAQKTVGNYDTLAYYYAGLCSVDAEEYAKGVEIFESLISINYLQDGMSYYYLATSLKGLGKIEEHVAAYEKAFQEFPEQSNIMAGLINAYIETNRNPEDIVLLIRKAQEINPTNISLYLVESDLWDKAGKLDEAYAALDKALEIDPNNLAAYYNYAVKKVLESDALVDKANKLDINAVKAYNNMVSQAEELRKEAVVNLEKCLEIEAENSIVLDLIGQMYFVCRSYGDEYQAKYDAYQAKYGE